MTSDHYPGVPEWIEDREGVEIPERALQIPPSSGQVIYCA
jgi:hypothetical protein